MDTQTARELLTSQDTKKPSEIREAVDVLYKELGTYQAIADQIGKSTFFYRQWHSTFHLPAGIQWKIDEGAINLKQGVQISRLKDKADQWLLAFIIIETKDLTAEECKNVVNLVLNEDKPLQDALSLLAGIRFDKIQPLLLPLGFDIRLEICKVAWARHSEWGDLCYQFILQGLDADKGFGIDIEAVVRQLESLTSDLKRKVSQLQD